MNTSAINPIPTAKVTTTPRIRAIQPLRSIPLFPTKFQFPALITTTIATISAAMTMAIMPADRFTPPPHRAYAAAPGVAKCRHPLRPRRTFPGPNGDPDADGIEAPRNDRTACRLSQRSDDQCGRGADLPDDKLSVPGHRACLEPVRPERARQYLHPHHEPDQRRAGAACRGA